MLTTLPISASNSGLDTVTACSIIFDICWAFSMAVASENKSLGPPLPTDRRVSDLSKSGSPFKSSPISVFIIF